MTIDETSHAARTALTPRFVCQIRTSLGFAGHISSLDLDDTISGLPAETTEGPPCTGASTAGPSDEIESGKSHRQSNIWTSFFAGDLQQSPSPPPASPPTGAEPTAPIQGSTTAGMTHGTSGFSFYYDAVDCHDQGFAGGDTEPNTPSASPTLPASPTSPRTCSHSPTSQARLLAAEAYLKHQSLLAGDVLGDLIIRLEKMILAEQNAANEECRPPRSLLELAGRLAQFLDDIKLGRLTTGEDPQFVALELECVDWVFEAVRAGVFHLPCEGCRCPMVVLVAE